MARLIETAMPRSGWYADPSGDGLDDSPGLVMTLLGTAETRLDGQRLLLNRRQTEILALLALHPEGLSLEHLHALVYGDQAVTLSTLKAEVSHLRSALGGQLASRPYRLTLPTATDVDTVLGLLRRGDVGAAVGAYGGDLLPGTNSPALIELADYVAVALREALLADPQPDAVLGLQRARALRHRGRRGLPGRRLGDHAPPRQGAAEGPARRRRPLTHG